MTRDGEAALSRWSRLKRERAAEATREDSAPREPAPATAAAAAEAGEEDAVRDLPDVETLDFESDFSGFLKAGVPHQLQKMALRKLWLSDPVLANVDGLNDYDLDYSFKEVAQVAMESAQDLARGGKRKNVSDMQREAREADARAHAEGQHTAAAGAEAHAGEAGEPEDDAETALAGAARSGGQS